MTADIGREIVDRNGHGRNVAHLRALGVALPRISDLADPPSRLAARAEEIAGGVWLFSVAGRKGSL